MVYAPPASLPLTGREPAALAARETSALGSETAEGLQERIDRSPRQVAQRLRITQLTSGAARLTDPLEAGSLPSRPVLQRVTITEYFDEARTKAGTRQIDPEDYEDSFQRVCSTITSFLTSLKPRLAKGTAGKMFHADLFERQLGQAYGNSGEIDFSKVEDQHWTDLIDALAQSQVGSIRTRDKDVIKFCRTGQGGLDAKGSTSLGTLQVAFSEKGLQISGRPMFHANTVSGIKITPSQARRHVIAWHDIRAMMQSAVNELGPLEVVSLLEPLLADLNKARSNDPAQSSASPQQASAPRSSFSASSNSLMKEAATGLSAMLEDAKKLASKHANPDRDEEDPEKENEKQVRVITQSLYLMNSNMSNLWAGNAKENISINSTSYQIRRHVESIRTIDNLYNFLESKTADIGTSSSSSTTPASSTGGPPNRSALADVSNKKQPPLGQTASQSAASGTVAKPTNRQLIEQRLITRVKERYPSANFNANRENNEKLKSVVDAAKRTPSPTQSTSDSSSQPSSKHPEIGGNPFLEADLVNIARDVILDTIKPLAADFPTKEKLKKEFDPASVERLLAASTATSAVLEQEDKKKERYRIFFTSMLGFAAERPTAGNGIGQSTSSTRARAASTPTPLLDVMSTSSHTGNRTPRIGEPKTPSGIPPLPKLPGVIPAAESKQNDDSSRPNDQ